MILPILPIILVTIITGNATAQTDVSTSVTGGSQSVTTNVTTTVNGQTYTVTSTEPGTLRVQHSDEGIEIEKHGTSISTITPIPANAPSTHTPDQTISASARNTEWLNSVIKQLNTLVSQMIQFFYTLFRKTS